MLVITYNWYVIKLLSLTKQTKRQYVSFHATYNRNCRFRLKFGNIDLEIVVCDVFMLNYTLIATTVPHKKKFKGWKVCRILKLTVMRMSTFSFSFISFMLFYERNANGFFVRPAISSQKDFDVLLKCAL